MHGAQPTVAAVFTGSPGRVEAGLKLYENKYVDLLRISGFGGTDKPTGFLNRFRDADLVVSAYISFDRGKDTKENALLTAHWARATHACRIVILHPSLICCVPMLRRNRQ